MEEDVDVYAALPNPEDKLWTLPQKEHIRELRMFSVRQPWPLLLAARRALDESGFTDVLRTCSIISFRYNVIGGLATNEQERVYNETAQKIAGGALSRAADVIKALSAVYIPDDQFRPAFTEKVLRTTAPRNKHIVRYVLFRIEKHISGTDYDIESEQYSLEHILPENPGQNWPQFSEEEAEENLYRLGNMTMLERATNRDIGNTSFTDKKGLYASSSFKITKSVAADNSDWNVARVAARQSWMANQATSIWRIAQLA
jgi:hypothetical protein